ncbi:MAG: hypothetical protein E2O68_04900 [Deltaproteobacteria bacterium]|nr:MAG: hypothetical protein E2O68_04900 [Deltaproteobacteria bacterium]
MKLLLVISILFTSSLFASGDLYEDCLDKVYSIHHVQVQEAQETLRRETEECYRYPMGERYHQCQGKAQSKYEDAIDSAESRLKQSKKSCLKFPWI